MCCKIKKPRRQNKNKKGTSETSITITQYTDRTATEIFNFSTNSLDDDGLFREVFSVNTPVECRR
jgi:hypothetical protein